MVLVNVDESRLIAAAEQLGRPDFDVCPTRDRVCFNQTGHASYTWGDPVKTECTNCWVHWIVTGE